MANLGFIGLGVMGGQMVDRLLNHGHTVTGYNRTRAKAQWLIDKGMKFSDTPGGVSAAADVTLSMVTNSTALEEVAEGPNGILSGISAGKVLIDMSTVSPAVSKSLAKKVREKGADMVDAPVSGSKGPAASGQLLILASGPREAEAVVRPAFSAIGRKTVWLGEAGQGSRMKLVVNAYMSILIEGVAEALELADRLGVDRASLAEAIEGGPLDAPIADAKLHKMERGDYAVEFPLKWALKDVDLALASAGADPPPLLHALSPQWHAAVDAGLGGEDVSAARAALAERRV